MFVEDLEEELDHIFPNGYSIETDKYGQIVIHTGLTENEEGELIPIDEEVDEDIDEDIDRLDAIEEEDE